MPSVSEHFSCVSKLKTTSKISFHKDVVASICYPFGTTNSAEELNCQCLAPLYRAIPDMERRDLIIVGTESTLDPFWMGCMGNYFGTFTAPLLNIPPTNRLIHMRYHEFFKVASGRVIEVQAIWDIPELMMQANSWPMAPQLGSFICTPGPMTCDGTSLFGPGSQALNHVQAMLEDMSKHPSNPDPAIMQLEKYWHPHFNWYGPCGIGTSRGIKGFRNIHQIPFLRAMPDRRLDMDAGLKSNWISQGNYVCETGWPNMRLTLSNDGWMGLNPSGVEIKMRSLDFWRLENGLIRENWVLIDLLDIYKQLGVDVFDRMSALPTRM